MSFTTFIRENIIDIINYVCYHVSLQSSKNVPILPFVSMPFIMKEDNFER